VIGAPSEPAYLAVTPVRVVASPAVPVAVLGVAQAPRAAIAIARHGNAAILRQETSDRALDIECLFMTAPSGQFVQD
jgi:hypothetical protein